ncbi:DUF6615 family protein [Acinetobacter proteolyticus]|uniref:DUF6615 family protein n=1 Tax=Acinetobacter proteolyticus TaxID=1776741 RepID=UPI0031E04B8D
MSLEDIFKRNSAWVWNSLREARKLDIQLGEESITDFLILNLKKTAGKNIKIQSFTRNEEALNGADWAWWFTGPSGKWLGMRVQAKVIKLTIEKYMTLNHKNQYGIQTDLLVKDAKIHRMIPIYCMFTNWDPNKYRTPQNCGKQTTYARHYGAALLSISNLRRIKAKRSSHLSNFINNLIPLHCIFCFHPHTCMDLPYIVLAHALSNGFLSAEEADYVLQDKPPFYVQQILDNESFEKVEADDRLKTITIFQAIAQ